MVSVCPSHAVRAVLTRAAPHLEDQILISASKGIEVGTRRRMSEVIVETLGDAASSRTVVLSGPSFAEELLRRLPTAVVAASRHEAHALAVQSLFRNDYFRVYTQPDVDGVELGGALKNVIALGAGISDGLELGSNARGGAHQPPAGGDRAPRQTLRGARDDAGRTRPDSATSSSPARVG